MKRSLALLLAVVALASVALAGEKSNLPRQIVVARYVYVTDFLGRSDLSPSVHSQDRQAIYDVQQALKQWGRYTVVYLPQEADIVLVVRSGRLVSAQGTGGIPVGGTPIGYPRPSDIPNSPFPGAGCTERTEASIRT